MDFSHLRKTFVFWELTLGKFDLGKGSRILGKWSLTLGNLGACCFVSCAAIYIKPNTRCHIGLPRGGWFDCAYSEHWRMSPSDSTPCPSLVTVQESRAVAKKSGDAIIRSTPSPCSYPPQRIMWYFDATCPCILHTFLEHARRSLL